MSNQIYKVLGKHGRITIPFEIRKRMDFAYNDILSFSQADDETVIVKRVMVCDDCSRRIDSEPNNKSNEEVTLLDFLDGLPDEEQRAALIHLSVIWAQKESESECNR